MVLDNNDSDLRSLVSVSDEGIRKYQGDMKFEQASLLLWWRDGGCSRDVVTADEVRRFVDAVLCASR